MIGGDGINDESNKTAPAPFRNIDYFNTMIYTTYGKLDLRTVAVDHPYPHQTTKGRK